MRDRIQISADTACRLTLAGKGHWLKPREDSVVAKGKGVLETYWLDIYTGRKNNKGSDSSALGADSSHTNASRTRDVFATEQSEALIKRDRMVGWMTELLVEYIRPILAKRRRSPSMPEQKPEATGELESIIGINEVVEAISLPRFDMASETKSSDETIVEIDSAVLEQIREFVSVISLLYRDNPFHNFEHACHVTMSVSKHLKRIRTCHGPSPRRDYG